MFKPLFLVINNYPLSVLCKSIPSNLFIDFKLLFKRLKSRKQPQSSKLNITCKTTQGALTSTFCILYKILWCFYVHLNLLENTEDTKDTFLGAQLTLSHGKRLHTVLLFRKPFAYPDLWRRQFPLFVGYTLWLCIRYSAFVLAIIKRWTQRVEKHFLKNIFFSTSNVGKFRNVDTGIFIILVRNIYLKLFVETVFKFILSEKKMTMWSIVQIKFNGQWYKRINPKSLLIKFWTSLLACDGMVINRFKMFKW